MVLLIDAGVDLEAVNRKGRSAFSFAAAPSMKREHNLEAVRILVEKGGDTNRKDNNRNTAKEGAAMERRDDVVALIEQFSH